MRLASCACVGFHWWGFNAVPATIFMGEPPAARGLGGRDRRPGRWMNAHGDPCWSCSAAILRRRKALSVAHQVLLLPDLPHAKALVLMADDPPNTSRMWMSVVGDQDHFLAISGIVAAICSAIGSRFYQGQSVTYLERPSPGPTGRPGRFRFFAGMPRTPADARRYRRIDFASRAGRAAIPRSTSRIRREVMDGR